MRHFTLRDRGRGWLKLHSCAICLLLAVAGTANGQAPGEPAGQTSPVAGAPVSITLDEAMKRAEANEPAFAASLADSKVAALDRSIARAGLLPSAVYHNQALYTQPLRPANQSGQGGASSSSPIFIANNAVREYSSQAVVNETVGLGQLAGMRHADAAAAHAAAELEIARRGLRATVIGLFYGSIAAENKLAAIERAHHEAVELGILTGKREQAREAAHADVVKAQLQEQQRKRDLSDAKLAAEKAKLELGVLLFADPRTPYTLVAAEGAQELPVRGEVDRAAAKNNPELKSALAVLGEGNAEVLAARAAYLPDLAFNYTYGIDAPQFATYGPAPDHLRNLGYSASVTVDIPVWDWFSTQHKLKQSELRRDAARVALTATQRRLIARLDEAYSEAAAARDQLASLDDSVATARESLRLTKLRYTGGEATVLEVVDAQSALVGAETAREEGRVRYQSARADLETLTGTM